MQRKIFVLLFLASRAEADGTDVTNNLFSDLGPLLALFGESFAQQFLRESFTWLDHIIFAMAPLGIITAIIGAIRVGGPPQLKALIGRARENRASAELDFMSSTSHEVSELWNGHGIVRTMGKGKVKQILFLEGRGPPEKFGLFTLIDAEKDNLITRKELWRKKTQNLGEKTSVSKSPNNDSYNNMSGRINPKEDHVKNDGLDRAPNISLNIHPKQNRGELFAAAVLGFILQVGVIIFSAFVAYDTRFGAAVGGHPSAYAFPTLASGTAVLVFGMGVCALVIGESTDESVWELKADGIVSTLQGEQNHQSELKVPSGDVEAGGANHSHNSHKHLWKRIIGVFAKTSMKEGERKTKFLSEILKSNAKKCDSENRKFRVFWLQQRFVVSDQTFDSYMLMARMEKELIMTSCRSDNRSLGTNYSRSTTEDSLNKTWTSQMRTLQIESPNTVSNGSARSPHIRSRMSKAQKPPISSKQMPPYESTSKWINTLCIIGTSTGIIGFILQFEGFRGISWACSIAQLVAILIMTVVRAIIRRGMLDRPIAQKIPEKYEIDWLALRIGNDDKYLSDLSESTGFPTNMSPCHLSWKICSQIDPPVQATPGSIPITNDPMVEEIVKLQERTHELETRLYESMPPPITNICADRREIPVRVEQITPDSTIPAPHECVQGSRKAPETLIKECLRRLTNWEKFIESCDPAKNSPMRQKSVSIRKRLQEFTDYLVLTGWSETIYNRFETQKVLHVRNRLRELTSWSDPIGNDEGTYLQKIELHATRKTGEEDRWSVSTEDIESILSLWMYHFSHGTQSGNWAQDNTENIARDIHSFQRVIGPSKPILKRDMAWWAGIEIAEALGEFSWDNQPDKKCLSMGVYLPGKPIIFFLYSPKACSTLKFSHIYHGGSDAELDHNKVTKGAHCPTSSYYAMIASVSKEKFLAQHIFSTFLWAVVNSLPLSERENEQSTEVVLPGDDELRLNEEHPNWNSLRLTNKKIKQMTKAIEISGLGTLEDANLLIIPPLSYYEKLPNEGIVDMVRKYAKDNELGYRDIACNIYGNLLKLCDDLPPEGNFVYKVVSTTVDFLVTATSASETKEYMETSDENLEKSKKLLVITLLSKHKQCLDMLQSLYAKQGRLKKFEKVGLLDTKTKDKVQGLAKTRQTILHREVIDKNKLFLDGHMEQFFSAADILGWTPLHYGVIYSLEAVQKLVDKRKDLVNKCDLAGRTPLHYAVMKRKDNLKQDDAEEIIKELLKANAIPLQGRDGLVPLHWAVKTGNIEATRLLLKRNLHVRTINFKDYSDMTPLHFAALGGHSEIVEILLNKIVNAQILNAQDRLGRTALHVAVKNINNDGYSNRAKIIEKLINKEASVVIKDKDDKKALDVAVEMEQKMQRSDSSKEPSHHVDVSGGVLESEHRGNPDNSNGKVDVNGKAKNPRKAGETEIPSKEEQLASSIKSLLRKENLTVDGGDLLLRAVEEKQNTPFEFLIDWKEIAFDMSQLDSANGRSILHLAVHAKSDMMVDRILKRWKPSNSSPPSQSLLFIDLADRRGLTALMLAASQGYEPGVKKLLAAGVKKDLRDINGRTALSWGAESGRLDILTQLIESDVTLKNEPMTKNSPLFIAVQNGKHEATELFLAKGADSNEVDDGGDSVLCDAVIFGHKECVQVLIDHGAKLEKESGMYKQTALSFAAKNGNLEIVKLLLNSGARLEAQDTDGWTPLIWALRSEHPKVVKFLIGEEVRSVSSKDQYMEQLNPAMTLACNTGDEDLVEQLLVLGVNPNAKDVDSGSTALIEASRGGLLRSVKRLLKLGGNINAMNNAKEAPLLLAARHGFDEITKCLLDANANIEIKNESKETPLLLAVRYDNEVVTKLLLTKGADANAESNTDETPLILATRNRNDDITKLLLEKKADVDKANNSNETPLSLAVIDRNVDIIKLLLNNGASVDQAWGKYEQTCLLQAIYVEDEELVLLLLESGARPEREQKYTRNALQEAIWWRAENIVDHLLSFGASAGLKDTQGRSAFQFAAQIGALSSLKKLFEERPKEFNLLESTFHDKQDRDLIHHAFASGSMDMISYLIDRFPPNKYNYRRKDSDGWTPLHWAAQTGDLKVVQRLLEPDVGLDARVRELLKNWTPRQIASYNNRNEIVEFLESFSIPDEVLPSAGFSHESVLCDGCNCKIRGFRFHCKSCENFDFCEKCKFTSDVTHPNHEFDEIGPGRETEPTQEVSPQQEIGLQQDGSSSEECSIHEDSNQDDAASQTVI
ncbi:ankyrin repeat protein [Botrytis cinerea]